MTTKLRPYDALDHDLLDAYPEIWEPLPDTAMQERPQQDIKEAIRSLYGGRSDVFVSGNTGVYYEEGNPDAVFRPDCYVVFGEGADRLWNPYAYRVWDFGKPPDFALEIASKSTYQNDLSYKRELYARVGIGEYWRYDPTGRDYYGEPLVGEYLAEGAYRRFDLERGPGGIVWAHSPALALDLYWKEERLQFYDPNDGRMAGQRTGTAGRAAGRGGRGSPPEGAAGGRRSRSSALAGGAATVAW